MRDILQALYEYWHTFGIPAYPTNTVPDDAQLPYITYDVKVPYWRGQTTYYVRVWYDDTSYSAISQKVKEISDDIGEGKRIKNGNAIIYLFKEDTFLQFQPTDDSEGNLKIAYLSMIIHVLMA